MRSSASRLRWSVAMAIAALAVHQLRYMLAFGPHADRELAAHGHAYLGPVVLVVGALAAVAGGLFLRRLAEARAGVRAGEPARIPGRALWVGVSVALLGIYAGQELLEGMLAAGHPGGWHGVLGHGGLLAIPLSFALGALVVLGVRGARTLLARAGGRARRVPAERPVPLRPGAVLLPRLPPLATAAAGRAPPAVRAAHL